MIIIKIYVFCLLFDRIREVVYMERQIEPNDGQSGADVFLQNNI